MMNPRSFLIPALWWVVAFMVSPPAGAQVFQVEFRYSEKIISDYASLFNSAGRDKARRDTIIHEGILQWHPISDTMVQARVMTDTRRNTMMVDSFPPDLTFLLHLDNQKRAMQVSPPVNGAPLPASITSWISELNFKLPSGGAATERKPDGDFSILYSVTENTGATKLSKGLPHLLKKNGGRQAIIFSKYDHVSEFDPLTGSLVSLGFTEKKKQVLGRKVLACIERELLLKKAGRLNESNWAGFSVREFAKPIELFPRISAKERRDRMAVALLGDQDFADLEKLLATIGTMTGEQQFRLKSMLRSLLVLDSSSATDFSRVLSTWKPGSPAFEAVENAVIESKTNFAEEYIKQQLEEHSNDYDLLKSLLLKVTVADAITQGPAKSLETLLKEAGDNDTRNLAALALSNYALTIREADESDYRILTSILLKNYRQEISDTLQYLYVVGNAGISAEITRLMELLHSEPRLEPEIIFAMRNIFSPVTDSLVERYLLHHPNGKKEYASLLAGRNMNGEFTRRVQASILEADRVGDSTQVHALQYLLDHAWEDGVDLGALLSHSFHVVAYRREVDDFRRQASICDQ